MSYSFLDFLGLLGSVGLFLYGMKVMSEGLQKAAGDRLRNILSAMTRNRFTGMLTGFFITALIQSSSASTVMVVSFVNAGLMSLSQSMAVIMGANVGTTFTAWVIALFGFSVNISTYVVPLLAVAVPFLFSSNGRTKSIGEFMVGFAFLFMALDLISTYVPDLKNNPEMFEFLQRYADMGIGSLLIFLLVGMVLTIIIQSSAATFAITLIMCSKGWIGFDLSCAIVLGSNIGTCVTPVLASLSGNVAARRTALEHLMFNIVGTVWCICLFYPFCRLTVWCTELFGLGNPMELMTYVNNLEATNPEVYNALFDNAIPVGDDVVSASKQLASMQTAVSYGLSVFHTLFNIVNVTLMIWFTQFFVKIVMKVMPAKNTGDEEFTLKFIGGGLLSASELNISQAQKEIVVFAQRVQRMLGMAQQIMHTKDGSEFSQQFSRIEKYEEISDRMELEIANYLSRVAEGRLSNESKHKITGLMQVISDIESIADSCYSICKTLIRKRDSGTHFNDELHTNIDAMFVEVEAAMSNMLYLLTHLELSPAESDIIASYNQERSINNLRNQLRAINIEAVNQRRYEYQEGAYYMDIIAGLEKTGDYIINVVDSVKEQMRRRRV